MKKTSLSILFGSMILSSTLFAQNYGTVNNKPPQKSVKIGVSKAYKDGWWWYQEKYKTPDNKIVTIKYKLSPKEKLKIDNENNTNKLLKILIVEQKKTQKLQEKILKRLEYAFPNTTPKYWVNSKGKKCLANSSADCFIMPVITEAQHVPVLKNFIRNPSPKNSAEWLKWQAKYFNHVSNISQGLRFAFLNGGSDVYQTSTNYTYGDNMFFPKSESAEGAREAKILLSIKNKLVYMVFLGQNIAYERLIKVYKHFVNVPKTFMKNMKFIIVYPSEEGKKEVMKSLNQLKKEGYNDCLYFFKHTENIISPKLYTKYNIRVTPSTVVYYKNGKEKAISQIIYTGDFSVSTIRKKTIEFLEYYHIISPKEMGADKNWATGGYGVINKKLVKMPKLKKAINFNQIDNRDKILEKKFNKE